MQFPNLLREALNAEQLEILAATLAPASFAAGECIFEAGARGDGCYFIERGEVRLELGADEHVDSERVLGYLTSGALLGELSLLDGLPRSAGAFAETDVVAHWLSAAATRELGRHHPQIWIALLQTLAREASLKLRKANERLGENIADTAPDSDVDMTVARAHEAQKLFESWSEAQVDAVLLALAQTIAENAGSLAEATVKETRIGDVADKTAKNLFASLVVQRFLAGKPGIGVVADDPHRSVIEMASPAGVVFGIVPITNPVATAVFKTLIALKARCALILSFHRGCLRVGNSACEIMQSVLEREGVPPNLLQWVRQRANRSKTASFMGHPQVSLILATGGASMVAAAYRSGKPAIGVGAGNAPAYIAADADIEAAALAVITSKSYDNGLICGAEHNLVVEAGVREAFSAALERLGAAVLDPIETRQFAARAVAPDGRSFVPGMIGQAAASIAAVAGISRPYPIKLVVMPVSTNEVGRGSAWAHEKLAPVLSLFCVEGEQEAFALCQGILAGQGTGHTAIIHTRSVDRAHRFGLLMPASRILVNSPGAQGVSGLTTGLVPSLTLGCGTFGGNSTTDNVNFQHLQNIKRLAHLIGAPSGAGAGQV
jgi:acyl-CoA reductase-like NAD-dependent aldehyde dehydrogenase